MKSVASILVALCLNHLQNVNADVKVHRKSTVTTDKKLAFWIESYTDAHLTYALCDEHPQVNAVHCTVYRQKEPYGHDRYSCDVILYRPDGLHDKKRWPHISVYPFGQKYAALTVWEGRELKFTVVQMDNCNISEARMPYVSTSWVEFGNVTVVDHSDSFDVFFTNADLCGDRLCKVTVDGDGRIVSEPKPSIKKFVRSDWVIRPVIALDSGSSGNGYYYLTSDGNDYIHVLVKADGIEKSLARHPKPTGVVAVSKKNNLLGVCYQMDDKLECSQYDYDGNLKLNTTITSDDKNRMYADIYNLPNGGFYVFSAECDKRARGSCHEFLRFLMERVDANGTKTGLINFQGFDMTFMYKVMSPLFYENDAKEVCFSLAATGIRGISGRSELTANCFTDADFSK